MLGGKTGSKVKNISLGIRMDSSVYGSCVPVIFGRTRVSGKMIFAGNYLTHKSSQKKGGGKKGAKQTSYSGNFDWLLGFAPIVAIGDVWRNKDNFWPVGIGFQTFTSGPLTITNNPGPILGFISVIGTTNISVTFNDFGAPGPSGFTGTQPIPLFPSGQIFQSGTFPANIAPGGFDWRTWNISAVPTWRVSGTNTVDTLGISIGSSLPMTVFYFYQLKSKSPMASAGLQFEPILGNGPEFGFSGGSNFANQYPELAGFGAANLDLGTGNTAPNDNLEVISLYAMSQNGDANPTDVILDVILAGLPSRIGGVTSGFNWNHGLGFSIHNTPDGSASRPNCLADPPVPNTGGLP